MLNGTLTISVSLKHRLEYGQSLLVYGKAQVKTTKRMKDLSREYSVRSIQSVM